MTKAVCFLFLNMWSIVLFAQNDIGLAVQRLKAPSLHRSPNGQYLSYFVAKKLDVKTTRTINFQKNDAPKPALVPFAFGVDKLPFFCKIEHNLAVKQPMMFKFRLGSVEYVDELEGKKK
jgi:hypothetical protein